MVVAAAAVPLAVYLWVALRQLGYPYELEWMEGGSVEVAARVFHGQSIYVAPSLHYVPYAYTPLYYWVSGTLAHVTGIGFLPLRLVSLAASLGCFALLFVMVRRETGDAVAGMLAAGLFAATYEVGGAWLNIGRVDALFLCLLLAAVAVGRRAERWPGALACGLLFFAAFFTKQSGLLAAAPVLVFLVVTRRRVGLIASATVVATVAVSTLVLNADHRRVVPVVDLRRAGAPGVRPRTPAPLRGRGSAAPGRLRRVPRPRRSCGRSVAAANLHRLGLLGGGRRRHGRLGLRLPDPLGRGP